MSSSRSLRKTCGKAKITGNFRVYFYQPYFQPFLTKLKWKWNYIRNYRAKGIFHFLIFLNLSKVCESGKTFLLLPVLKCINIDSFYCGIGKLLLKVLTNLVFVFLLRGLSKYLCFNFLPCIWVTFQLLPWNNTLTFSHIIERHCAYSYQNNVRKQAHTTLGPWDKAQITITMTAKWKHSKYNNISSTDSDD